LLAPDPIALLHWPDSRTDAERAEDERLGRP
jgi:hypothetical protein